MSPGIQWLTTDHFKDKKQKKKKKIIRGCIGFLSCKKNLLFLFALPQGVHFVQDFLFHTEYFTYSLLLSQI